MLHGLQARPELNNLIGVIAGEWDLDAGRVPVAVIDDGSLLRVKVANLRPVPGSKRQQQQPFETGRADLNLLPAQPVSGSVHGEQQADDTGGRRPNNLQAASGSTSLHARVLAGDVAGARALLDSHTSSCDMRKLVDTPRGDGATALLLATALADWEMVRLLLRAKANPTIAAAGWTWGR